MLMTILEQMEYRGQLERFIEENPILDELSGKTLLLTGATGMIGSFLVDVLMRRNEIVPPEERVCVLAVARNPETAKKRFAGWIKHRELIFFACDIAKTLPELPVVPDFYIHAASTTHPVAYASEPVNTILSNVYGLNNLLEYMAFQNKGRLLVLSSVEIYGNNRGDTHLFSEDYCGYLNCNTLRAGYQEAKRVSESLCQAYIQQYDADVSIIRLPRTYGPTMRLNDSKAAAQFILNGVRSEDIVLKSEGNQFFSYAHTYDAVSGILVTLLRGGKGEAYNLADPESDIMLKDLAKLIADYAGKKVVFQLPNSLEKAGFSTASKALLNSEKLKALGWHPHFNIKTGVESTIRILRETSIDFQA